jgi:hypothetical protein
MLGSDATNTWPGCGEIDIMEHGKPIKHSIIQGAEELEMYHYRERRF